MSMRMQNKNVKCGKVEAFAFLLVVVLLHDRINTLTLFLTQVG